VGPLLCSAPADTLETALDYLDKHLKSFFRTRDISDLDTRLGATAQLRYVAGPGILRVVC
jgi:hypothetical protein